MSTRERLIALLAFVLGALSLLVPAAGGQTEPTEPAESAESTESTEPAGSFSGRIEVTAVEIMIEVRDRRGKTPADLEAADFEVLEDGAPVEVIGLDYPPPEPGRGGDRPGGRPGPPRLHAEAWRFVVYFETVLTDARTIKEAARTLFRQAPELTRLGSVEVVVADPSPRVALPFTRDPESLQEALHGLTRWRRTSGNLARVRRDFLIRRDLRLGSGTQEMLTAEAIDQIRSAVRQEKLLVEGQLERLRRWLSAYGQQPASAILLVSDGFDIDPAEFYLAAVAFPEVERRLTTELYRYRFDAAATELAREISARGFTSISLAPRGVPPPDAVADASLSGRERYRSIGAAGGAGPSAASPTSLLQRPTEPLLEVAAASGGEVLTNLRQTVPALGRLGRRLRLTYQAERPADGEGHRLEVRLRRGDLELTAPRWTSSPTGAEIAASRVRRLLVLGGAAGELPVEARLELEAESSPADRRAELDVVFDLDPLAALLTGPRVTVRFTLGVALAEGAPFIHQLDQEVPLPPLAAAAGGRSDGRRLPRFETTLRLALPPEAGRVAVVVEEPASGSWGGNVASAPGER